MRDPYLKGAPSLEKLHILSLLLYIVIILIILIILIFLIILILIRPGSLLTLAAWDAHHRTTESAM